MSEPQSSAFYSVAYIPTGKSKDDNGDLVDLSSDIYGIAFVDNERGPDTLEISLDNHKLDKLDSDIWYRGSKLRLVFGHSDRVSVPRVFKITEISGGRVLQVKAESAEAWLDTRKKSRKFENVTRSQVVRILASDYGLPSTEVEDTSHVFESISQSNTTDFELMTRLARKEGFQLWIDEKGVNFKERPVGKRPSHKFIYHVDPNLGDIIDFEFDVQVRKKPAKVKVKGRDPLNREDISVEKDNQTDPDRDVMSQEAILFTPGEERTPVVTTIPGEGGRLESYEEPVCTGAYSKEEVQAEAKGRFRRVQQSIIKLTLTIRGNASVRAKNVVMVEGMGDRFSTRYYVQSASHNLTANGGFQTILALSTDGVAKGKGSGRQGVTSAEKEGLNKCVEEIKKAIAAVEEADSATSQTQIAIVLRTLATDITRIQAGPASKVGLFAQKVIENLYYVRAYGKRAGLERPVELAELCLAEIRPLTAVTVDQEANTGKQNTQQPSEPDELEAITFEDSETRKPITKFVKP